MGSIHKNQKGFAAIEVVLVVIVLALVGFVGWYVWKVRSGNKIKDSSSTSTPVSSQKQKQQQAGAQKQAASTPAGSAVISPGSYTDAGKNFSVKFPTDWVLKDTTVSDANAKNENSSATLTSPRGTVLHLNADFGGRGGECPPNPGDKPFQAGNNCSSWEYLSTEAVPSINNVYYIHLVASTTGQYGREVKKSGVVIATAHYADNAGTSSYLIGLTQSNDDEMVQLHNPKMGVFVPMIYMSVYDAKGDFHPYIYAYASGDSEAFLSSADAATIKTILKSLVVLK